MDFVTSCTSIKLNSGLELDTMTYFNGFPTDSSENCFNESSTALIYGLTIPFLHINHLIEAKKQIGGPKDLIDSIELEKIKEQRDASED